MLPSHLAHAPAPAPAAEALSAALQREIAAAIESAGGWISFARFMELALYAPGLGYYSAGSTKLGTDGDFVTAPELSPLFGRCVARQIAQITELGATDLIEVGAGSGKLAAQLLLSLEALERIPSSYAILELSADLRERQRAHLAAEAPHLIERVQWLDALPERLRGVVIANEVLDAMPTHRIKVHDGRIDEIGVTAISRGFEYALRPAGGGLLSAALALDLGGDYETEINLAARAFVASFAARIERGMLLFIDYGFPAAEYYHPQRSRGTLMCHYRHHAHDDALALVGLQDITAHVDFTAVADAGTQAGLSLMGYATQAQFLINCGITEALAQADPTDVRAYAPFAAAAQKLLSPAEMGELFKVIALGNGLDVPLMGFACGDRTHTL